MTHPRARHVLIWMRALVTGATGFVGGKLVEALAANGAEVRCMVRDSDSERSQALAAAGHELHEGDVLDPPTLNGAGRDVDVAYYLIHSMGRGGGAHARAILGGRARRRIRVSTALVAAAAAAGEQEDRGSDERR